MKQSVNRSIALGNVLAVVLVSSLSIGAWWDWSWKSNTESEATTAKSDAAPAKARSVSTTANTPASSPAEPLIEVQPQPVESEAAEHVKTVRIPETRKAEPIADRPLQPVTNRVRIPEAVRPPSPPKQLDVIPIPVRPLQVPSPIEPIDAAKAAVYQPVEPIVPHQYQMPERQATVNIRQVDTVNAAKRASQSGPIQSVDRVVPYVPPELEQIALASAGKTIPAYAVRNISRFPDVPDVRTELTSLIERTRSLQKSIQGNRADIQAIMNRAEVHQKILEDIASSQRRNVIVPETLDQVLTQEKLKLIVEEARTARSQLERIEQESQSMNRFDSATHFTNSAANRKTG